MTQHGARRSGESAPPFRIFLVDDHPIVREGVSRLVEAETDMVICGDAEDSDEALEAIQSAQPDVVILDISLKSFDGIELTKLLRERGVSARILILSMHDAEYYAERALQAGANGYIMKERAKDHIIAAIRRILDGHIYLCELAMDKLLKAKRRTEPASGSAMLGSLTDRELEVFRLLGHGKTTLEIADTLGISAKTVAAHRVRMKKKLRVSSLPELMRLAVNWVEQDS